MPSIVTLLTDLTEAGQVSLTNNEAMGPMAWDSRLTTHGGDVYRSSGTTLEKCVRRLWLRVFGDEQEVPA